MWGLFFLTNTNVFSKMGRSTCARHGPAARLGPTFGGHGVQRCGSSPAPAAGGPVHAQAQVLPAIRFVIYHFCATVTLCLVARKKICAKTFHPF